MPALFDLGANLAAMRGVGMRQPMPQPAPGLMAPMAGPPPPQQPTFGGPGGLLAGLEQGISSPLFLAGIGLMGNGPEGLQQGLKTGAALRELPLERRMKEAQIAAQTDALTLRRELADRPEFKQIGEGEFGQSIYGTVDPRTGKATPSDAAPAGTGPGMKDIVEGIASGNLPPSLKGFYGRTPRVMAELQKRGVDLTQLQMEHAAAQKQIASLNGPQMVRFSGLAHSVVNTIDEVNNLAKEMDQSGLSAYNKAKLAVLVNVRGNSPEGQVASRYLAAVNTLKEEFANLAQGGYAPTEAAWHLADQQINADYGVKQLNSALNEVQRLIKYRIQGIPNFDRLGPGAANRYIGNGQAPQTGPHGGAAPAAPAASGGPDADGWTDMGGVKIREKR